MRVTVGEVKAWAFDALPDGDGEVTLPASVVLDMLNAYVAANDPSDDAELGE